MVNVLRRRATVSMVWLLGWGLSGCAVSTPEASQGAGALSALEQALRGLERESLEPLAALLPTEFNGRAALLDAARKNMAEQKQLNVRLSEVKAAPGAGALAPTAISARWEKRYLRAPTQTPALQTGALNVVMRQTSSGVWMIESLGPDNPFVK